MSGLALMLALLVIAVAVATGIAIDHWIDARRARTWHVECRYCGFTGTYRTDESLERGTTWHRQMCHPGGGS